MYFLNKARLNYKPKYPKILQDLNTIQKKLVPLDIKLSDDIKTIFPHLSDQSLIQFEKAAEIKGSPLTIGVLFSGGQAAGGHNVIAGIFDALGQIHQDSKLIGFLDGPLGVIKNRSRVLKKEEIDAYRNQGGFDLLGSGRTKIEKPEDFDGALKACSDQKLDGLIIIGGDDSNTNAALLAEFFIKNSCKTVVVGVPKTIDGDLKSDLIEASFGFDTAAKTFSTSIGSLLRDALSAKKYTFFVKLMGRTASHIALECALATHPNLTLIGEEIAKNKLTLSDVVKNITDVIEKRARIGKNYGVILIPEGVIEFIHGFSESNLPLHLQERDPHGNLKVSQIETERLFIELVTSELQERNFEGKFSPIPIFLGYEGRSCLPSNFDANYCYSLGLTAAILVNTKATATIACIKNLASPPETWQPLGVPLPSLMALEKRQGSMKPVIKKAMVDLHGQPFLFFKEQREKWIEGDDYHYPGPIQFYGPEEIADQITLTLKLESQSFVM